MVSVPVRALVPVFAATEILTVPFPLPLAPAVIVIHAALLVAVQVQLLDEGVTVTLAPAAPAPPVTLVADSVKEQLGGGVVPSTTSCLISFIFCTPSQPLRPYPS